jgi:hypothetical protein
VKGHTLFCLTETGDVHEINAADGIVINSFILSAGLGGKIAFDFTE